VREVDLAHAASADPTLDPVATDPNRVAPSLALAGDADDPLVLEVVASQGSVEHLVRTDGIFVSGARLDSDVVGDLACASVVLGRLLTHLRHVEPLVFPSELQQL
jgi:hypothetical protein